MFSYLFCVYVFKDLYSVNNDHHIVQNKKNNNNHKHIVDGINEKNKNEHLLLINNNTYSDIGTISVNYDNNKMNKNTEFEQESNFLIRLLLQIIISKKELYMKMEK